MEILYKSLEKKREANIFEEIIASKNMMRVIGRDVNKSVCNLVGLVDLLNDENAEQEDFKTIQKHLNTEVKQLHELIKNMCTDF